MAAALMVAGVALDLLLGEARRWHPLVGFGRWADVLERTLNRGTWRNLSGVLSWMLAVMPLTMLAYGLIASLDHDTVAAACLHAGLLYFSLGLRSLYDHAMPIQTALLKDDLPTARTATACIVSRDTAHEDATGLAKAGIESLLENGNDAVFGTLFWFMVAGGPGALLFRLTNTLDAMWGYRTARYHAFGWAAARADDLLNTIPARLTALSYTLLGNTRLAWQCWVHQAPSWSSPNAGPVMAAGAGALELALGGAATYNGVIEQRPALGGTRVVVAADIGRAWKLVRNTTFLWLIVVVVSAAIYALIPAAIY